MQFPIVIETRDNPPKLIDHGNRSPAMDKASLRALRLSRGLSQERLAERLGLSPRHYKRLESGATPIRETLSRLIVHELT